MAWSRMPQQFGGGIVAGKGAHPRRMLARHQRVVADIVAGRSGSIAGSEDAGHRRYAQIAVNQQPAEIVALGRDLRGQRRGANACRPDHGLGLDTFAVGQRDAGCIQRGNAGTEPGLHAELAQRLLDDGTGTRAHIGSDRTRFVRR